MEEISCVRGGMALQGKAEDGLHDALEVNAQRPCAEIRKKDLACSATDSDARAEQGSKAPPVLEAVLALVSHVGPPL